MTEDQIIEAMHRFLRWKLPADFSPDGGISFKPMRNENTPWPERNEPVGTNLFNFDQAEAMIRHILGVSK